MSEKTIKPRGFWDNYENVRNEALKFKYKGDFKLNSSSAFKAAEKHNWLVTFPWLKLKITKPGYWKDKDNCRKEALKYKTRSEFRKNCYQGYIISIQNSWIDEFFPNYRFDSLDKVDCIYIYKFEEQHTIYVGRTVRREGRDYQHHTDLKDAVYKFFTQNNLPCPKMEVIEDNLTIQEGQEQEGFWKNFYESEGWILLNKSKTGGIGPLGTGKWTHEKCKELANNCKGRLDFQNKYKGPYLYCLKKHPDWLDEFFPCKNIHLKPVDQLNSEGTFIKTFSSIKEASKETGINETKIIMVCKSKRKKAGGFKWRYHKEN